jgi:hypothetical protein
MKTQRSNARAIIGLVAAMLSLLLMAIPAIADSATGSAEQTTATTVPVADAAPPASDHDGDADSDPSTAYTEDKDTNDGTANNVPDEGDNAHPSGKDRSVEHGGSGNQGNSESDPDDNGKGPDRSNGGADKPNGPGGVDLADQDGNNGCGNDDDFEDDNEGWCGHKPKKDKDDHETPGDTDNPGDDDGDEEGNTPSEDHSKVTICHATGSAKNPFVKITPSASGVFHGHLGHQDGRDIIPPFTYKGQTYSQNWPSGQALFDNGCEEDTPPVDEGCPEGQMENEDGDCVLPDVDEECPEGTMENEAGECITPPVDEGCPEGQMENEDGDCVLPDVDEECPEGTMENEAGECVTPPVEECPTGTTMPIGGGECGNTPDEVLGEVITSGGMGTNMPQGEGVKGDKVLPKHINKPAERKPTTVAAAREEGAKLPFTGSNIMVLLSIALGLMALGLLSLESTIVLHNASVKRSRR